MGPAFTPTPGADGWQLSNPPVLALAPLRASLEMFSAVGLPALRERSLRLTGYLEALIRARLDSTLQIVTPADPAQRGAQLSLRVAGGRAQGRALFDHLASVGVIGDWREPNIFRVAPVPLYNSYLDVFRFVEHFSFAFD